MRGLLKRASVSVSDGGSSASGAQPSITTSTDQNTDVTRASSEDYIGSDVAVEGDSADEHSAGHRNPAGPHSRRRITTKRGPREVRDEQSSTTEQRVPRSILGKTTPQEHAVAVTTQEALDGPREKTMRIANVENNALNWVSISSAGALDMMHCDFRVRSVLDEMRHHWKQ